MVGPGKLTSGSGGSSSSSDDDDDKDRRRRSGSSSFNDRLDAPGGIDTNDPDPSDSDGGSDSDSDGGAGGGDGGGSSGGGTDDRLDAPEGRDTDARDAPEPTEGDSGGLDSSVGESADNTANLVTRAMGAPEADNPNVEQRLNQAENYINENYGDLDREDYRLRVTESGDIEFGGLTREGREEAIERDYLDRGAESADVDISEDITVSGAAGDRLMFDQTPDVNREETFDIDVDWGDQPDAVEAPDGEHVMTRDQGKGPDIGTDEFEEGFVEARIERETGTDVDVEKTADGSFDVETEGRYGRNPGQNKARAVESDIEQFGSGGSTDRYVNLHTVTGGQLGDELRDEQTTRTIEQEETSSLVSKFEETTGLDVPGDGPIASSMSTTEEYGDWDWSLGLGGPEDEVEQVADAFTEGLVGRTEQVFDDPFGEGGLASESAGEEILKAVGKPELGRKYEEALRKEGETILPLTRGAATGTASLVGQVPQLVTEAPETTAYAVTNARDTANKVPGTVAAGAVNLTEGALSKPVETTGALLGSAAVTGKLFTATQGTRLGTASRVALQPGEELVKAGIRQGALGARAARITPGVKTGQAELDSDGLNVRDRIGAGRDRVASAIDDASIGVRFDADAPTFEVDPLLKQKLGGGPDLGKPISTDLGKKSISERIGESGRRRAPTPLGERPIETGQPVATSLGAEGVSTRVTERISRALDADSPTDLGRPLPTDLGTRGISERVLGLGDRRAPTPLGDRPVELGQPLSTSLGVESIGERAASAVADRFGGVDSTDLGRPLATDLDETPISTRVTRAFRDDSGGVDLGRPLSADLGETAISTRFSRALRDDSDGVDFGRPLATDLDETPISTRLARRFSDDSDGVDLGRPLATDLGETAISTRFARALRDDSAGVDLGRPLATDLGVDGISTRLSDLTIEIGPKPKMFEGRATRKEGDIDSLNDLSFSGEFILGETESETETTTETDTDVEDTHPLFRDDAEAGTQQQLLTKTETEPREFEDEYTGETGELTRKGAFGRNSEPTVGASEPADQLHEVGETDLLGEQEGTGLVETEARALEPPGRDMEIEPTVESDIELGREFEPTGEMEFEGETSFEMELEAEAEAGMELETEVEQELETFLPDNGRGDRRDSNRGVGGLFDRQFEIGVGDLSQMDKAIEDTQAVDDIDADFGLH